MTKDDDLQRAKTLNQAIRNTTGAQRVLSLMTFQYEHGTGTQIIANNYDPNDKGVIAEDLIRALTVLCDGRNVKVHIDGSQIDIGIPMSKEIADMIWKRPT